MAIINLTEGTHTIKWTLSGYNDLTATIRVSSSGQVTCVSVVSGSCGGYSTPRVSISGTTVTAYMKSGTSTPSPTPTILPTPTQKPTHTYVRKYVEGNSGVTSPMVEVYDPHQEGNYYIDTPNSAGFDGGGGVKYDVTVPKTARYKIVALTRGENVNHNSFYVSWDYGTKMIFDFTPSSTFKWGNVSNRGSGSDLNPQYPVYTKELTPGRHTLKFFSREVASQIKKFYVTGFFWLALT